MKSKVLLILLISVLACEPNFEEVEPVSMLQVDAVFRTGRIMPVIEVKRSVGLTPDPRTVDPDALYVSGAKITLRHLDEQIEVFEIEPGKYKPRSSTLVERGDRFSIEVEVEGEVARAEANVPDYPYEEITVAASGAVGLETIRLVDTSRQINELYQTGIVDFPITLPYMPEYMLIRSYEQTSLQLKDVYSFGDPLEFFFRKYTDDYVAPNERIVLTNRVRIYDKGAVRRPYLENTQFFTDLIIPEPIYEDYSEVVGDQFAPVNVTNVENGLGLFIGAIDVTIPTLEPSIPVNN